MTDTQPRPPPNASINAGIRLSSRAYTHSMDRPYGWPGSNLAISSHSVTRCISGRRMAMQSNAIAIRQSSRQDRTLPQADSMALLLTHGAHDKAPWNPLCRNRAHDWSS